MNSGHLPCLCKTQILQQSVPPSTSFIYEYSAIKPTVDWRPLLTPVRADCDIAVEVKFVQSGLLCAIGRLVNMGAQEYVLGLSTSTRKDKIRYINLRYD